MSLRVCWTGTNSLCFTYGGYTLWVDPFFSRPPAHSVFRRVLPDRALVARYVSTADAVLVSHAHYDHLMDVPDVLRITSASAYGSPNTAAILRLHGIPEARSVVIQPGDTLALGPFQIDVLAAWHTHTPLDRWINGIITPAALAATRLPLRLVDYRMDTCFSFRIQAGGSAVLVGNHPAPADVVFVSPYVPQSLLHDLLVQSGARLVVPVHWDDFTRPLSQPLQPMLVTRRQGVRGWRLVGRVDPVAFARQITSLDPAVRVMIPTAFAEWDVDQLLSGDSPKRFT